MVLIAKSVHNKCWRGCGANSPPLLVGMEVGVAAAGCAETLPVNSGPVLSALTLGAAKEDAAGRGRDRSGGVCSPGLECG